MPAVLAEITHPDKLEPVAGFGIGEGGFELAVELFQKIICYCISAVLCIFYIGVLCLGVCADTEKEYKMYYIEKTLQRWIGVGGLSLNLRNPESTPFPAKNGESQLRGPLRWPLHSQSPARTYFR